ncbi:MAG: NlpC/P60 family protein [Anaerosporomusa subterranea]|jgi:cell wall-associated NlpC family hydrolase|nr:NlpC/P60 family protein [Anaerosporomusa subterranea]
MTIKKYKASIVAVLLLTLFSTTLLPATPAYAASLSDLLAPTTSKEDSGGSGIIDILIGLLLGTFVGNVANDKSTNSTTDTLGKVLGWSNKTDQTSASSTATSVLNTAKQYMGVPYVWGGETPTGFDCSGFTQYVLKQNGITIPRTAAEQYQSGVSIMKSNLKTGDLVFFTTYKPGASHVGFYMGDGKFIHASSGAKQVTISSLDESYYTEKYIGARRYIQ